MKHYHFRSHERGREAIAKRRLKIAGIYELNDPFEFIGVDLTDFVARQAIHNLKAYWAETLGLICFSKNWSNPIQWSH